MKRVTRKQDGGATTCKEDYFIVQYGKYYLTDPNITDYNTHYKLFKIELYLSQFWVHPTPPIPAQGFPQGYPPAQGGAPTQGYWEYHKQISEDTLKMLRRLYLIQECIDDFIIKYGNNEECIDKFINHVNAWHGNEYIQPKQDKVWFVDKKGKEVEAKIKRTYISGFNDFVERYSESLNNFIDKYVKYDTQYNEIIERILVDGEIDNRKIIGVIHVDETNTIFPPDHIPKFLKKLREEKRNVYDKK